MASLLAMMLTTIKITENQEEAARQARSADEALKVAINQLQLNQTIPVNALRLAMSTLIRPPKSYAEAPSHCRGPPHSREANDSSKILAA
jgi:hypothetical protein